MKNKKGSIVIYFAVLVAATLIIVFTAVLAPAGVLMTSELYAAGEQILLDANESISSINDPVVRGQLQNATAAALDAGEFNIEVNSDLYQYSWIIVLILTGFIGFLFTRSMVERQVGGGLI